MGKKKINLQASPFKVFSTIPAHPIQNDKIFHQLFSKLEQSGGGLTLPQEGYEYQLHSTYKTSPDAEMPDEKLKDVPYSVFEDNDQIYQGQSTLFETSGFCRRIKQHVTHLYK